MLCKKGHETVCLMGYWWQGHNKDYVQHVTKVVFGAESPEFACVHSVSTIWLAWHLKLIVIARCCLINSSHNYCGMSTNENPKSFNCSFNAQKCMEFSLEVVVVQDNALVLVVSSGLWIWCCLGSHLWTIFLFSTWEVTEDDSNVDFGCHSCFGLTLIVSILVDVEVPRCSKTLFGFVKQ